MAIPPTYNDGTASINAGETAATGQGTTWLTSGLRAGDLFWAAGLAVRIASVNSNTSLTLAYAWPGANRAAQAYEIRYTPDSERVLAASRKIVEAVGSEAVTPLIGLTTAADRYVYYTGPGAAALGTLTSFARSLLAGTTAAAWRALLGWREVLTANRTYYVRTDGNDANTGLANTAGGAFKTIQKAINVVAHTLDFAGWTVTIQVADGTYPEALVLRPCLLGSGTITILGNTAAPANVVISPAAGHSISCGLECGRWSIDGVKLAAPGASARLIQASGLVILTLRRIEFGASGGAQHILAESGARIFINGTTLTISGGSAYELWNATSGSGIQIYDTTVTITASFTVTRFVSASLSGVVVCGSVTFSLGANVVTGTRYVASHGGGINTNGGGANFFPGTIAGSATSPGWYS